MIADFFTKPLQGRLFKFFCDVIMGRKVIQDLEDFIATPVQERVESNISVTEVNRPDVEDSSLKSNISTKSTEHVEESRDEKYVNS